MNIFIPIALLVISIIFFSISKMQDYINKKGDKVISGFNCIDIIDKMLSYYNFNIEENKIKIKEKNIFGYSIKDNSIWIKNIKNNKYSEIVPSLHEVGHYIVNNKSVLGYNVFKISQYIIAINRILILPLYIILFLLKNICNIETIFSENLIIKYSIFTFFCLASLLKVIIGLSNEIMASNKAIIFIKSINNKELVKFSMLAYTYGFISQTTFTIIGIILGILLGNPQRC